MAKTNVPQGRTRQSRRLGPDVKEEETATNEHQANDEPENTKAAVEGTPQTEDKSDPTDNKAAEDKPVPVTIEDEEADAVIEVKGNAPTVSVSWEKNKQQDQEVTVSKEENGSPPVVVVVKRSDEADTEDAEMETAACEDNECVPPGTNQEGEHDGEAKRKRKAKSSVDSSPSKKTKLINDGYCVHFGNLNNSKFFDDVKTALANYLMTQSLLIKDIRLDKTKKHAFVDLASEMDLNKALTLNGEKLLDKPMRVSRAKLKEAGKVKVKDPQQVKQAKNERSIFVENIPVSATREEVLKAFPKASAVRFLGGAESPSKGVAFVEFQNRKQAKVALRLSGKVKIQECLVQLDVVKGKPGDDKAKSNNNDTKGSPSDTLFVGNLPKNVREKHIKGIFKNAVHINIPQKDRKSRGYAFVQFESLEQAQTALNSAQKSKILNRSLKVQFGLKPKMGQKKETPVSSQTLVVMGLDRGTTARTLKEAFEGALSSRIFEGEGTGVSKKFGFVEFESVESCIMAKESVEDIEIDGCKVTVTFAREKSQNSHNNGGKAQTRGKGAGAGQPLPKGRKKVTR
ncbi:nucleolin-like [Eucyclogobius newberryi]|uniref:nucleolin-like n=1 Tax=Eucyclogobius newberryi TaxID=166745 RepID=UPI003B59FD82